MIRKLLLYLACMMCMFAAKSQTPFNGTVLNYELNNTPIYGVKIKTNMPFSNSSAMPTIIIEGYNYGGAAAIGVILTYYIYDGAFTNCSASSFGGYTPRIVLGAEDGKVVIFLDDRDYFARFTVRVHASGSWPYELPANFTGWSAADEALTGSALHELQYKNIFAGRVGIGTVSPVAPLHIASTTQLPGGDLAVAVLGSEHNHWTYFGGITAGRIRGSNEGYIAIESATTGSNNNLYLNHNSTGTIVMGTSGAKVGIGTTTPGDYKLAVEGTIGARKVKVTNQSWADFVFEPDYKLITLPEIEAYIKANKHLPEIPSQQEVEKEGLDLGEINKKLLQKIEELTLHLIEENKRNTEQAAQIEELKKGLDALKAKQ